MKKKHHIRIRQDFGLVAATLGLALTIPAWAAQPAETDPVKAEIRAVLKQHDEAMDRQDVKALLALYADDPTIAMMGTGPGEFWKGRAEVESAYQEFLKDFKAGSLKHECPETSGSHHGEVAWLVASCNMQDVTPDDQTREYVLNVSAVLRKEKDGWKFQTLHFSNLTAGDPPPVGRGGARPGRAENPVSGERS